MLNIDKYKVSIEDLKCKDVLENLDFKTTKEITATFSHKVNLQNFQIKYFVFYR